MSEQATNEQVEQAARGTRKTLQGHVVATKMEKTIVVRVERTSRHALYHKTVRIRKKFYVHDEKGEAGVGDRVEIMGTRPMSKLKRWRLVQVLEKGA